MLDGLAQEGLGSLLHLDQNHGADLLGREGLGLAVDDDLDIGLGAPVDDVVGHELLVLLNVLVIVPGAHAWGPANQLKVTEAAVG